MAGQRRDHLAVLKDLDKTWTQLQSVGALCMAMGNVDRKDEDKYSSLLGRSQSLHGRVGDEVPSAHEAFRTIFANPSLRLILRQGRNEWWRQLWGVAGSAIKQSMSRLEAEAEASARGGLAPGAAQQYIPPRSQFDAYVALKDILQTAARCVVVVDPYTDDATLQPLKTLDKSVEVRLLTVTPPKDFAHALQRFRQQWGGNIEARQGTKELHDRFLLVDDRVFFSGASFKDLGQRGSLMGEIQSTEVKDAVKKDVQASWSQAQPIA